MNVKIEEVKEFWAGLQPLHVFRIEGRWWVLADELADILDARVHHLVKFLVGTDKGRLYGDFMGQDIGELGAPIIAFPAAVGCALRGHHPRRVSIGYWMIREVVPSVYAGGTTWIGEYKPSLQNG